MGNGIGVWLPEYSRRKIFDPEDTYEINAYENYGRSVLDNIRNMEFVYAALMMRADFLESGRLALTSKWMHQLEFASTLSLHNDSLFSSDTAHFKKKFALPLH